MFKNNLIIAIDLSTKPGVAIFSNGQLKYTGTCFNDKTVEDFGKYPNNYIKFVKYTIEKLLKYVQTLGYNWNNFDKIILEETTSSRNNYSQKKLEFLHYEFLLTFDNLKGKIVYIRSEVWKRITNAKMSKEEKSVNAKIYRLKRQLGKKVVRKDIHGNSIRKVTRHDSYIRRCNELFDTKFGRKEEDAAAACLLGLAFLQNAPVCDGTIKGGVLKAIN